MQREQYIQDTLGDSPFYSTSENVFNSNHKLLSEYSTFYPSTIESAGSNATNLMPDRLFPHSKQVRILFLKISRLQNTQFDQRSSYTKLLRWS